jgi:acyl-CoA thioesterase-1
MHSMRHRGARRGVRPANPIVAVAIACAWAVIVAAGPAFAAPIKVACIGEQTTHGDLYPPGSPKEYPALLQKLMGSQYDVQSFGDCCASVLQGYTPAETHPYVLGALPGRGPGYNESLAFLPDIVVIGSWGRHDWGMNRLPGEIWNLATFQKDYDDLVQRYMKLASHPKIYVSTPIPILFGQGTVPDNGVTTESVLPAIKAVAAKYNLPIIDLYTAFLGRKDLFRNPPLTDSEGEHINDTGGFQHIADTVFAALTGASDGGGGSQDAAAGADAAAMDEGGPSSPGPDASADEAGTSSSGAPAGPDSGSSVAQGGDSGGGDEAGAGNGASGASSGSAAGTGNSGSSGSSCSMTARGRHPAPIPLLAATIFSLLVARRRKPTVQQMTATTRESCDRVPHPMRDATRRRPMD